MKKTALFLALAASLFLLVSCSEATKQTKTLYGHQWWPVYATGEYEDDSFKASWSGPLDKNGGIEVTFVNKKYPDLSYVSEISYPAFDFSKERKAFCYLDIRSLGEIIQSKYLQFYIKDGKIYFEKADDKGRGTGEFGEGLPIKFTDEENVQIGDVKYQEYRAWRSEHPIVKKELGDGDFIPVAIYQ